MICVRAGEGEGGVRERDIEIVSVRERIERQSI